MLSGQCLKLPNDIQVASQRQVGFDARLEGRKTQLTEASDFRFELAATINIGEGMAAPQCQRTAQYPGRFRRVVF